MKHKVDKKRLISVLLFVPLVTIIVMLFCFYFLLLPCFTFLSGGDAWLQVTMAGFYGLYACYPIMLLVGLPTIIMIERRRPKKRDAYRIYIYVAILATIVPVVFIDLFLASIIKIGDEDIGLFSVLSLVFAGWFSGFFTGYVMLDKREDWD